MKRLLITIFLSAAAVYIGLMAYFCLHSPNITFLSHSSDADWIMCPAKQSTAPFVISLEHPDVTVFAKTFNVGNGSENLKMAIRAYGDAQVQINGKSVKYAAANWKDKKNIDVSRYIKPGINKINVDIISKYGPALLCLNIGQLLKTDSTWMVSYKSSRFVSAAVAEDSILSPISYMPTPWHEIKSKWAILLMIFLFSSAAYIGASYTSLGKIIFRKPVIVPAAISAVWLIFLCRLLSNLMIGGFDAGGHLDYISYIAMHHSIPYASEGWEMYQPPFFYILSAVMLSIGNLFFEPNIAVKFIRIIPFFCGLGNIWLAYLTASKIFQNDHYKIALATFATALIPMNIYMSAYISNEITCGFMLSLVIFVSVSLVYQPEVRMRDVLFLAAALGLALITKVTALLIVPFVVVLVCYKLFAIEHAKILRAISLIAVVCVGAFVLSGWFYIRNYNHFGRPIVGNWDHDLSSKIWWQQPGFHTIDYYTRFGEVFQRPYFSGFHSFFDGLYSTFWGDALAGGAVSIPQQNKAAWNFHYMSMIFILAVPVTFLLVLGIGKAAKIAVVHKKQNARIALLFILSYMFVVICSIIYMTLKIPFYSQEKAFYGLSAIIPISIFLAFGIDFAKNIFQKVGCAFAHTMFYGYLGMLACVIYISFIA